MVKLQAETCVKPGSTLQIIMELRNTCVALETERQAFNCPSRRADGWRKGASRVVLHQQLSTGLQQGFLVPKP
ncbi:uncharacterized [Tachysurus ichikawai]